jgi:hypothetical protein
MPSVIERLRVIVTSLPDGAAVTLPAETLRAWLAEEPAVADQVELASEPRGWREKLWTCPPETRLGVPELAEALDRSPDWVYRATSAKRAAKLGRHPLPCARLDGVLVFTAGALRRWVEASASIVNPDPVAARVRTRRLRGNP